MGQSMSTVSPDTVGTVPRPSRDRDLSSPTSATPTELFASSPQAAEDSAALRKRMTANQLQAMDTESESSLNVASSLGKRRTDATVDGGGQDATFDDGGMANLSPNYTEPLQVLREQKDPPPSATPESDETSTSGEGDADSGQEQETVVTASDDIPVNAPSVQSQDNRNAFTSQGKRTREEASEDVDMTDAGAPAFPELNATHQVSASDYQFDLDALLKDLEEKEKKQDAESKREAARAAAEARVTATPTESAAHDGMDLHPFATIDFSRAEVPATGLASLGRKSLDLAAVASHLDGSQPAVEFVTGRKVVLMLGNTGVGKSLLLQALAGRTIVQRPYRPCGGVLQANDEDAMELCDAGPPAESLPERLVWDVQDPLDGFSVGHQKSSETKCLRHFAQTDDSVVYLDAPGYEDTAGVEVDIATSIAFKWVAQRCSELRFLVLVDCNAFSVDRGGAMRRVAMLVSKFVRGFEANKMAFTFIFTKTEALGEASSHQEARQILFNVLKETLLGTSDGDTKDVLNWIINCLYYDWPFVNVYQPALSQPLVATLREGIETFRHTDAKNGVTVTAISKPREGVRCGLTTKAESKIKIVIDAELEELVTSLGRKRATSSAEILRTLGTLRTHVDEDFVEKAHEKAMKCWGDYGKDVLRQAYQRMDDCVSEHHGREALDCIAILRLFDRHQVKVMQPKAAEHALGYLCTKISDLYKLATTAHSNLEEFKRSWDALEKLKLWGEVHLEFKRKADDAEVKMSASLNRDERNVSNATEFRQLVPSLRRLWHARRLGLPGVQRLDGMVEGMRARAGEALAAAPSSEAMTDEEGQGSESLHQYRSCVNELDQVSALLGAQGTQSMDEARKICGRVAAARRTVLGYAKDRLKELHSDIGEVSTSHEPVGLDTVIRGLENKLDLMSRLAQSLSNEQHAELCTVSLFAEAVSNASALVRKHHDHLLERCERELIDLKPLRTPDAHLADLKQLASCSWLDTHLASCGGSLFVRESISKLHERYERFGKRALNESITKLGRYLDAGTASSGRLEAKAIFVKDAEVLLQLCSNLGGEIESLGELRDSLAEGVESALGSWKGTWMRRNGDQFLAASQNENFNDVLDMLQSSGTVIDEALDVCSTIEGASLSQPNIGWLMSFDEQLRALLTKFATEMSGVFNHPQSEAAWLKQSKALVFIRELLEKDLRHVQLMLPNFDTLAQGVQSQLNQVRERARTTVNGASGDDNEAEEVLTALTTFSESFRTFEFGREACQEAEHLREKLELRRTQLDQALQESLQNGDFSYVRDYIEPLIANRHDALKQQKLRGVLDNAKASLRRKLDQACRSEDPRFLVETIRVLGDACQNIGSELEDMDLISHTESLKDRVFQRLRVLADRLDQAIQGHRFHQVAQGIFEAEDYLRIAEPLLTARVQGQRASGAESRDRSSHTTRVSRIVARFEGSAAPSSSRRPMANGCIAHDVEDLAARVHDVVRHAKSCLADVKTTARRFITHLRHEDLGRPVEFNTESLCTVLHKLKESIDASSTEQRAFAELSNLYNTTRDELSEELRSKLNEVQREVLLVYKLKVFRDISRELGRGLRDHVTLGMDVDDVISKLEAEETRAQEQMCANNFSIEYIDQTLRPVLDKMKDSMCGRLLPWRREEYLKRIELLSQEFHKLIEQTRSLGTSARNFERAGRNIPVIRHALRELAAHVEQRENSHWREVEGNIISDFTRLCEQCQGALKRGDRQNFELRLRELHDFEENLTIIDAEKIKEGAMGVHKAIHVWTKNEAERLVTMLEEATDLNAAVEAVHRLRGVGQVLVSVWTLYVDSADESNRHKKTDRWIAGVTELIDNYFGGESLSKTGKLYALLELNADADKSKVERAFRQMSRKYHPDRCHISAGSNQRAQQELEHAKCALSNDDVRDDFCRALNAFFSDQIKLVPDTIQRQLNGLLETEDYAKVREMLLSLDSLPPLLALVDRPAEEVKRTLFTEVERHLRRIQTEVHQHWELREYKELNSKLGVLDQIDRALGGLREFYDPLFVSKMRREVEGKIEQYATEASQYVRGKSEEEAEQNMRNVAWKLIELGRILDELAPFKPFCRQKMAAVLDDVHCEGNWGFCFLFKLGMLLGQGKVGQLDQDGKVLDSDDRIGKTIVAEFNHFKDLTTMVWNEEVPQKPVGEVLKDAKAWRVLGTNGSKQDAKLDEASLAEGYTRYQKAYKECLESWMAGELTEEVLAQKTINEAAGVEPGKWSAELVKILPSLLAKVFCFFTISKSGESYKRLVDKADTLHDGGSFQIDNVLLKPHCTQVLTVLQMLGYGGATSGALKHQLVQIRTGEGKSIILGACSTVLALLGFRVRCVCYSNYLSERDYELFRELFESFGVIELVEYSTISDYSEDLTKRKGDIRELTKALLLNQPLPQPSSSPPDASPSNNGLLVEDTKREKKRSKKSSTSVLTTFQPPSFSRGAMHRIVSAPEILLVDEVDVFFGEDFYGNTHNQVLTLDLPDAVAMLQEIWRLFNSNVRGGRLLREAKNSVAYRNLLQIFEPDWHSMVEREVNSMCADVVCYDEPKPHYDIGTDKLGYKVMDGIDYDDRVFRYRTAFAHLHAADKGRFRDASSALQRALKLLIPCGNFSYANIQPQCILGVSGTLEALGKEEFRVMKKYGIEDYTSMPSVYGRTNFGFDHAGDAISVEETIDDFHRKVTEVTNYNIRKGRAVIVFFDSKRFHGYTSSVYFKKVQHANVLHEGVNPKDRDFVIRKAATNGQATFASEAFGRGTDFFSKDSKLDDAGGVHVLQTFFSLKSADEVQIQGRTARQGKKGTYGLVLLQEDLSETLGLTSLDGVAHKDRYGKLVQQREAANGEAWKKIEENLAEATRIDTKTHLYFDALLEARDQRLRSTAVSKFLALYDELRVEKPVCATDYHVIFLVDRSGSMNSKDSTPSQDFCADPTYRNRLGCAYEACHRFVEMRQDEGASDLVSLILFGTEAVNAISSEQMRPSMITDLMCKPGHGVLGGTAFHSGLEKAWSLIEQDRSTLPVLIMFMTDGDDHGNKERAQSAITMFSTRENVSMKAIGFGDGPNLPYIQSLLEIMGDRGELLTAIDGVQLVSSFVQAAAELSHTGRRKVR